MASWHCTLAVMLLAVGTSGCATCCAPFDEHYPAVGGRWVRDNPTHGRVGSAFEPAGHKVDEVAATPAELTPAEPTPALPGTATPRPRRDGALYLPTE
jgi:hypothetical protein